MAASRLGLCGGLSVWALPLHLFRLLEHPSGGCLITAYVISRSCLNIGYPVLEDAKPVCAVQLFRILLFHWCYRPLPRLYQLSLQVYCVYVTSLSAPSYFGFNPPPHLYVVLQGKKFQHQLSLTLQVSISKKLFNTDNIYFSWF